MKVKNASMPLLQRFPEIRALVAAGMLLIAVNGVCPAVAHADTPADVQKKIDDTNAQIAALEKEIAAYENTLTSIGTQKQTLQSEIDRLDLSRKKINADISVTQTKVTQANLKLSQLGGAITDKEARIATDTASIGKSLRKERQSSEQTLVEHLLVANGLLDAWQEASKLATLNQALRDDIHDLAETKASLTVDYNATNVEKAKLVSLKNELAGQKSVLDQNRAEQASLLAQTKNKESEYQKLIDQKQEAKAEFERQLSEYESTLKYTLDPAAIPKAGSGVLSFPLDPDFMNRCPSRKSVFGNIYCITQYFGNTAFAQGGAYNGKGHNGVDFGSPEGTKIVAAASGVVDGTGNTDLQKGCYSYGKWVLVKHDNGLATIYAHLSVISVSKGERVTTGQLVGYSGSTGYVTGPHLHFGLYVASQVRVTQLSSIQNGAKTPCSNAIMPVAPTQAYLNPMSYL